MTNSQKRETKFDTTALIQSILQAVDPARALRHHVSLHGSRLHIDDRDYELIGKDIQLIAVGKAAVPMAQAMQDLLGAHIVRSIIVTKYGHSARSPDSLRYSELNHKEPKRRKEFSEDCVYSVPFVVKNTTLIEAAHPIPDDNSLRAGELICAALQDCGEHTLVIVCVSGGASALVVAPQPDISLKIMQAINDALLKSGADIREMNAVRSRLDRL